MKHLYINLDEATDRRLLIEQTFPSAIRFPAILDELGYIGCTKSHIACLKIAIENNWDKVLIMEDDAMIHNPKSIAILKKLLENPFDVILLGGSRVQFNPTTYKLFSAFTTTAYIVSNKYYKTLLENFEKGLYFSLLNPNIRIDTFWKVLQAKDQWFIVNPAFIIQRPCYSYIEKRDTNYAHMFNL